MLLLGKYDDCMHLVRRTPEWTVCTYFTGPWGECHSYGLDLNEVEKFMSTIPYGGDDVSE